MYSDEYFIPTVKSTSHKDFELEIRTISIKPKSSYQNSYKPPSIPKKQKESSDQNPNNQYNQKENTEDPNLFSETEQNIELAYSKLKSKRHQSLAKSSSQSSNYIPPLRSTLLDWDIKETQHKKRNLKDQYEKGVKIQSNKNVKKEKSDYWNKTKVDSCAQIVIRDGYALAIPSYHKQQKQYVEPSDKFMYHTSYMQEKIQEAVRPQSKAGDKHKPLCKYDPKASRNMLPSVPYQKPNRNASNLKL